MAPGAFTGDARASAGGAIASYGGKPDLATYGLDKPAAEIDVTLKADKGKPEEHKLAVGKITDPKSTDRFARVDQGPIFVLAEPSWRPLLQDYLGYVDPTLSKLDPAKITSINRQMNGETVEWLRKNGGWEVKAKATQPGDAPTINNLVDELAQLRALRVAAYPAKNPATFGLDKPAAVFTIRFTAPTANQRPKWFKSARRLMTAPPRAIGLCASKREQPSASCRTIWLPRCSPRISISAIAIWPISPLSTVPLWNAANVKRSLNQTMAPGG